MSNDIGKVAFARYPIAYFGLEALYFVSHKKIPLIYESDFLTVMSKDCFVS